jgi:hypothetical protein
MVETSSSFFLRNDNGLRESNPVRNDNLDIRSLMMNEVSFSLLRRKNEAGNTLTDKQPIKAFLRKFLRSKVIDKGI